MPMRGFRKSRKERRFRCPRHVDKTTCEHVLRDVWALDWNANGSYQGVPPNPYLDYWANCVQEAHDPDLMLDDSYVAVGLVSLVRAGLNDTVDTVRDRIVANYPCRPNNPALLLSKDQGSRAFTFAMQLWLHIRLEHNAATAPQTVKQVAHAALPKSATTTTKGTVIDGRLTADFCAEQLSRAGGIYIRWTDDISQHLHLEGNTLHVFRHSGLLRALRDSPSSDPLPPGLASETLQTLYLLYRPLETRHLHRNIRRMEKYCDADLELAMASYASFDLKNYQYWHERLLAIQTKYNQSTPSSLRQYWYDRRNEVQWATFWMGLLVVILTVVTVVFGIIQCVTGILQVM